jgi:hypothetical protein
MFAHVDQLGCLLHSPESCLHHFVRGAHESDHGAIGGFARIDVQHLDPFDRLDRGGDSADDRRVPSLAEVRHALEQGFAHDPDRIPSLAPKASFELVESRASCPWQAA